MLRTLARSLHPKQPFTSLKTFTPLHRFCTTEGPHKPSSQKSQESKSKIRESQREQLKQEFDSKLSSQHSDQFHSSATQSASSQVFSKLMTGLSFLAIAGGWLWVYNNTEYKVNPITEKKQFFLITSEDEVALGNIMVAHLATDYDPLVLSEKENKNLEILQENVIESFSDIAKKYFGAKLKGLHSNTDLVSHQVVLETNVPQFIFLKNGHLVLSKNMLEDILVDENLMNALIRLDGSSYMYDFGIHENSLQTLLAYKKLVGQFSGDIAGFSGLYPEELRTLDKIFGVKYGKREFNSINNLNKKFLGKDLVDHDFNVLKLYLEKYNKERPETIKQSPENESLYKYSICAKYGEILHYDSTINNK